MQAVWNILRSLIWLALAGGWIIGVAWGIGQATNYSWALWLEHWTGDFRTALFSHRPKRQNDKIALISITDETMHPYTYRSPIDRQLLARLVEALDRAGARAIGLDFLLLKPTESKKDEALVAAIRKAKTRIVIAGGDKRAGLIPKQMEYQAQFLRDSGATGGYANLLTGSDRIVRYVAAPSDDPQFPRSFALALAKPDAPPASSPHRIAWLLSPHDGNERFFTIPAHLLVTPAGITTAANTLLARFKDKIVIIGGDFPDLDRHQVPMLTWRGEDDEVPGMLIQAQVTAQILEGREIKHLKGDYLLILFAVLALLGLRFGLRHGLVAVSIYASTASVLVVAADMMLFHFADRIIPFGACLAALIGGLVGALLLRRTYFLFTVPSARDVEQASGENP
jgi:CHASE2 domain-containing sensor protein